MDNENLLPQPGAIFLGEQTDLTLCEVCSACAVRVETTFEPAGEGVLSPSGREPHRWRSSDTTGAAQRSPSGCNATSASIWPVPRCRSICWNKWRACRPGYAKWVQIDRRPESASA